MKILLATVALSIRPIAVNAQDMPKFMKNAAPDASAALFGENTRPSLSVQRLPI